MLKISKNHGYISVVNRYFRYILRIHLDLSLHVDELLCGLFLKAEPQNPNYNDTVWVHPGHRRTLCGRVREIYSRIYDIRHMEYSKTLKLLTFSMFFYLKIKINVLSVVRRAHRSWDLCCCSMNVCSAFKQIHLMTQNVFCITSNNIAEE